MSSIARAPETGNRDSIKMYLSGNRNSLKTHLKKLTEPL